MGENAQVQILGELKSVSLSNLQNLKHLCKQIPKGTYAFQNLGELNVDGCRNMGYLISSSVALMLVNLKSLSVAGCDSMREAITMNEECGVKKIVFRSLRKVILKDLENLSSFCSSNQAFEFPSLEEMFIVNCPVMKTFCNGRLTAEKLHGVKPSYPDNDGRFEWKGDLNETVRFLNSRISRTNIRDKVMEALKDDKISIIGIWGIGGIGKTKILQEVCETARTEKLFDEVAMTTVSHIKDVVNIHKRLTKGRKILVVLDDIRKAIKLEGVGIPSKNGSSSYKVVLASRNESVCTEMGSEKNISVGVLSTEEAWHLFKTTAGDCVVRDKQEEIAKEFADECGGVPIALITLARTLSNQKRRAWENVRTQLRESSMTIPEEMNKYVYQSIMLSYNILASEQPQAQQLLLICCQHPEDAKIEVEKLARYCLALELFENVDIVDARSKTYEVINHLKCCFLLQAVDVDEEKKDQKDETVKMHDAVRKVCSSIVSHTNYREYMNNIADGGNEHGTRKDDYSKKTEQMEELKILENLGGAEEDVPTFQNLRMLSLERISFSKEIKLKIGKLRSLEILSFWQSKIKLIPKEIDQLTNLKLLDLRCAEGEGPIPSGILPRLKKLEALYMGNFFLLGKAADDENGVITELDDLSNLTALQIVLENPKDLLRLKRFHFEKLESFFLASLGDTDFFSERNRLCPSVHKTIDFSGMEDWILWDWILEDWILERNIQVIARSTVDLTLEDIEHWTDPLIVLKEFKSLKKLDLRRCRQLEYIPGGSLGELELLKLTDMSKLRRLWVGPSETMYLPNLREVVIRKCPALEMRKEPPTSDFMIQQPKLRGIYLRSLPNLTLDDGKLQQPRVEDGKLQQPLFNPSVMLPSLKRLKCFEMDGLKQIVGGGMLKFPELAAAPCDWLKNLEEVEVSGCKSLEKVFDFEGLNVRGENDNVPRLGELKCVKLSKLQNLEHLCWQIPEGYAFKNLGELNVESCDRLGYLISSSMAQMLVNLKSLSVMRCKFMNEVIKKNEDSSVTIVFPILSRVILKDLEILSSFCSSTNQAFEFPSLEEMFIVNCPDMKTFCYGHLTAEKLHGVNPSYPSDNDDRFEWKGDLNKTVRLLNSSKRVDLKEDDVSKEGSADENAKCIIEMESSRRSSSNFVESTSKIAHPSTKMHSDSENVDDYEDLQNKRRNTFDPNLGFSMQQIGSLMQQMSNNANKCYEILEKQFGQAPQGSETIP